jgi:hypothetical protein
MRPIVLIAATICLWLAVPLTLAQEATETPETTTFTSEDETFSFDYPADWTAQVNGTINVGLSNSHDNEDIMSGEAVFVVVYMPVAVNQMSMMGMGTTPAEIAQANYAISDATSAIFPVTLIAGVDQGVVEFTVNDRPSAYFMYSTEMGDFQSAGMSIFVDVGADYLTTIAVSCLDGGMACLNLHQPTVFALLESINFYPPEALMSENLDLPNVYSGSIGFMNVLTGDLTFYYPEDWQVLNMVSLFIQNTSERLNQQALESGQIQIAVISPEMNAITMLGLPDFDCEGYPAVVTAVTVIVKSLPSTPEQIQAAEDAGITYSEVETITLGGHDSRYFRIYQGQQEVLYIMVDLGEGLVLGLMAFTPLGEMEQYEETIFGIAASMEYTVTECNDNR